VITWNFLFLLAYVGLMASESQRWGA